MTSSKNIKKMPMLFILATGVLLSLSLFNSNVPLISMQEQEEIHENPLKVQEINAKPAADLDAFISIWNTSLISQGSSASNQVALPLESSGTYNFTVAWGDESNDTITSWAQNEVTHTYGSPGIYTITITGTIDGWRFFWEKDNLKIIEIQQWGTLRVGNAGSYFFGCRNLRLTTTDTLDLTGTTTLFSFFSLCGDLGSNGNLNAWDVSSVTDMSYMFCVAKSFNQPLDAWDVSRVTSMRSMFCGLPEFNQPLNTWDVSSVTDMGEMFYFASAFNHTLDAWDVSRVTDMSDMFFNASSFNQPLGNWNVTSVSNMNSMFSGVMLSTNNYDEMLVSWSQLPLQSGVVFDAGNSQYSAGTAKTARQQIIDTFGWTITDGGLDANDRIAGFPLAFLSIMMLGGLIGLVRHSCNSNEMIKEK
jgi:surface protein